MKSAFEMQLAVEIILLEKCPVELDEDTLRGISFEIVRLFFTQDNGTVSQASAAQNEHQQLIES